MKKFVSHVMVIAIIINCVCAPRYASDYTYDKTRPVPVSQREGDSKITSIESCREFLAGDRS